MKKLLISLSLVAATSITLSTSLWVTSCKGDNMIKIYLLGEDGQVVENERWLITTVDKDKLVKYTLKKSNDGSMSYITFYYNDNTVDNTQGKLWSGSPEQYTKYLTNVLGMAPTTE